MRRHNHRMGGGKQGCGPLLCFRPLLRQYTECCVAKLTEMATLPKEQLRCFNAHSGPVLTAKWNGNVYA